MISASEIVRKIKESVNIAENTPNFPEKKLRELVSPIWEEYLKEKRVKLNLNIRDELILANGRADTVFNRFILEYKKPHTIKPNNNKNRKLINQVEGYILDLSEKERWRKERLLGVVFDGNYFLYLRFSKRWIEDEPIPLNEKSIEFFFKNLEKLTSKAALIPENLIRDFAVGSESRNYVATNCIKAFYNEVNQHGRVGDTKEHVFFEQWKLQFAEVHGSLEQKKIDTKTLFTSYGFDKKEQKEFNAYAFFFALDSYYALLIKLLCYQVVGYYTISKLTGLPLHNWENIDSETLKRKLDLLEEGGIFREVGIRNFLEGDLFSWYTQAWNDDIYRAIKQIIAHLNDYDPETMEVAPDETRDILKKLYQYLVPRQIRHDLGEYYTPDWLAERCLNQLNYNGNPKYRILDPGCGSGTFLILAIKRAKRFAEDKKILPEETLKNILKNIQGFDLNPLAVITARTNYMLAIADLLKYNIGEITIPIYLCDSINPPEARIADEMTLFPKKIPYEVKTTVGNFYLSHSIINKRRVQQLANILEDCVKNNVDKDIFLNRLKAELMLNEEEFEESELYLEDIYDKLIELNRRGINGVWARIIKNAFAPLFVGRFDMVVGNPPWVNWESLPNNYREETKPLWIKYGLFSLKGQAARLGGGKKDISMLMTYVAIDKYLKKKGKLAFVITQTLFKTKGAGDGFRRFQLGEKGDKFKVEQVDDMVELQPFEGATNRTSVVTILKGDQTTYPLSYVLWRKIQKSVISIELSFEEVFKLTYRLNLLAKPLTNDFNGPWKTTRKKSLIVLEKIIGSSKYKAHAGCCTWMNGVYWGMVDDLTKKYITFENDWDIGKIKVKPVIKEIESLLVYPLLRGRDIKKWHAIPNRYIISSQDPEKRTGFDERWMKKNVSKTLGYFDQFKNELINRSGYKKYLSGAPFYSVYNVGMYTFSPYKVVWPGEVAPNLNCAVVDKFHGKAIIPDQTAYFVDFYNEESAHFFCAILNSIIVRFYYKSSLYKHVSMNFIREISIPQFNAKISIHRDLFFLSQNCHKKTAAGIKVTDLEERIDELAAEMWGLTKQELKDIQDSLEELS
jgi:type I restriction-modification system DNA methylase subunit